ncbi:putative aquaglyceroporin [Xylogone sp. PMI_703]|nr:putative aquaglyceroporin [Xylogone sp. PMI_703]
MKLIQSNYLGVSSWPFGTTESDSNNHFHRTAMKLGRREVFAEYFGSLIMVLFGEGAIAQVLLSNGQKGNYQSVCWSWGIGVMIGVTIGGNHLNPAVTFTNCVFRNFPWYKFPIYALAQLLGSMSAAAIIYGNYRSAINLYEGGPDVRTVPGYSATATAGIFSTYPAGKFIAYPEQIFSEFVASFILMFGIFALTADKSDLPDFRHFTPLAFMLLLFGIGSAFGWETGYAINMARDLGPRLLSYYLGYGSEVWTAGGYYFWVPIIVPFVGCVSGGWIYDMFLYTGKSPANVPWLVLKRIIFHHQHDKDQLS